MANTVKREKQSLEFVDDSDRWESGELGADENSVRVSTQGTESRIDEGLGLQMVSMRLPKDVVEQFKVLAREQGLGYQPFIRQILMNYLRDHK
ncbi:MAG: hypothetical protein HYW48_08110 [Deltaproteobacteria bacterium]|nr:hypothetical protein [Deltaproteobacteria bacterium]